MGSRDKAQKKSSKGSARTYQQMADLEAEPEPRSTISIAVELLYKAISDNLPVSVGLTTSGNYLAGGKRRGYHVEESGYKG